LGNNYRIFSHDVIINSSRLVNNSF
jgi:hypothetical protein